MARKRVWLYVAALVLVLGAALWVTLVLAVPSSQATVTPAANTLTVTKTGDTTDGSCEINDCSLREAIASGDSGDTIIIPAGIYTLTLGSELSITKSLTLTGNGADSTIIQAATGEGLATHRVFNIAGGNVAISGVTIKHGHASGDSLNDKRGGGIFNSGKLTLTNSNVRDNLADRDAGGIWNHLDGSLALVLSTVSGNHAKDDAGGILSTGFSLLTVTNSTISGNTSVDVGGGIVNGGSLIIINSNISGNTTNGVAGGIYHEFGAMSLINSTVSDNAANSAGGSIHISSGTVNLTNTIIANSGSGGDCAGAAAITSLGHNLDSDGTCGLGSTGDLSNFDALLGPLQDNGGSTFTHALLLGSPAIDAVSVHYCTDINGNPLTTDQRGVPRPQGIGCDIGAFEFRVPGDANGDWVVDMADLRIVAAALGSADSSADLNLDGLVDILDLVLVALNLDRGGP